jgi:ligand-binding sensor domain-containing protein/uncharacterized membrane-anchored protein YhcB (DUF1043 family)
MFIRAFNSVRPSKTPLKETKHVALLHTLTVFLLISIFSLSLSSQTPLFRNLDAFSRNSDEEINVFAQDHLGYIWIGTNSGLYRFDGIQTLQIPLPDSIEASTATAIHIHSSGIYFGLESGQLIRVNTKSRNTDWILKIADESITSILAESSNTIWAGTSGSGLRMIQNAKVTKFTTQEGLVDNYVHGIIQIQNYIAVGTDLGLSLCRLDSEKLNVVNFTTSEGLTDNLVTSLCGNGSDNILLGMQNGTLCNLNIKNNRIDKFEVFNESNQHSLLKILTLQENTLVISESGNAYVVSWNNIRQVQHFSILPDGKSETSPTDAIVDQEGNLILSFGDSKLYSADFRLQFVREHDGISFANAHCVLGDRSGNIWFSNNEGVFRHAGEFADMQYIEQFYSSPPGMNDIVSLCEDENHNIWFGTFGDGLGYINIESRKTKIYTEKDGLVNNNILSIDRQGETLWLATLGGACSVQLTNENPVFTTFDSSSDLASNYIYCIYTDSNNEIWFGTDGKGLVRNNHGSFELLLQNFSEMGKSVTSIAEDGSGNIWFVSTDKGLQWYNGSAVETFNVSAKSEKVEIFTIQEDTFGNIVALTSFGLAVISHETQHVSQLNTGFDVTTAYLNTSSLDILGRMWLATSEALIRYSDYNLGRKIKPRTHIESVEVMLVPIDSTMHVFGYDDHHVAFNVSSIWLQEPDAVIYQYKLIGYDIDWVTTRDRKILFSQLVPGDYKFLVRSSVDEDWEQAITESYSFTIRRPWWKNSWFSVGIGILIALILFMIVKMRFKNIRKKEALAREKVQSQFDTLRNQINPHFLFNSFNTLNSIIQHDQQAAVAYVEKLSDYFRIVLEQREKDVITVREELSLVESYLFLQKRRFGDNLNVDIQLSSKTMNSLIPPMALQLLTENAIKHNVISRNKPLQISIYEKGGNIAVSNSVQLKPTKEPSTGIGLDNISHRYRLLFKKDITTESNTNTFKVSLPIIGNLDSN